ncbi:unnamed protein product [Heterobilharzia americana]|nr:unnamed protein product [Heterobilharzia americana]
MTGALGTPGLEGTVPFVGTGSPAIGMPMIPGHFMGMAPSSGLSVPSMPPGMSQLLLPSLAGLHTVPSSNMTTKSLPEVADGGDVLASGYRNRGPASSGVVGGPGSAKTNGSRSGDETTVDAKGTQSLLSGANGKSSTSLTVASDMASVVHDMLMSDSGLEIHDRTWLKITIPNAFIGSELVDWLYTHVDGFADRRDARRYASNLLQYGYIRHTVNKSTFSEQCYYTFGDIATALSHLNLDEVDSVSEIGTHSASHTGAHPMMSQMYPHVHHVVPDTVGSASGLSSMQNQNISSNTNVGLMSSPIPGEGNSLNQTGSHYPYPPVFYPITSSVPASSSGPCSVDANGNTCNFVNPTSSTLLGQRNRVSNNSQIGVDSNLYPVNNTNMVSHTRPVVPNQPHIASVNSTSNQRIQQQKVNSSSSSSSRSSASSTSSSSTGYSGNRRPPALCNTTTTTNTTAQIPNTNVPQSMNAPIDTSASKGLSSLNKSIQRRADPPSVQSLSGTSSTSSASRQNGTGASAAGSGSGSAITTHVLNKPNNTNLPNKAECSDSVLRTHAVDFSNSIHPTTSQNSGLMMKEGNKKPDINQCSGILSSHPLTAGGNSATGGVHNIRR